MTAVVEEAKVSDSLLLWDVTLPVTVCYNCAPNPHPVTLHVTHHVTYKPSTKHVTKHMTPHVTVRT